MDELELTPGQRYRIDIFHAERHTWLSSFRIETTIECFTQPELI
jgi:fibro-slime domain-containing protein